MANRRNHKIDERRLRPIYGILLTFKYKCCYKKANLIT